MHLPTRKETKYHVMHYYRPPDDTEMFVYKLYYRCDNIEIYLGLIKYYKSHDNNANIIGPREN